MVINFFAGNRNRGAGWRCGITQLGLIAGGGRRRGRGKDQKRRRGKVFIDARIKFILISDHSKFNWRRVIVTIEGGKNFLKKLMN